MPNATSVAITAKMGDADGIGQITGADTESAIVDIYDPSGMKREAVGQGYNIVRTEDGKAKKIWQSTVSAE